MLEEVNTTAKTDSSVTFEKIVRIRRVPCVSKKTKSKEWAQIEKNAKEEARKP